MYIDLTPLDIKRFEKENKTSFLSLFKPTFANAVTLVMLVKRVDVESALSYVSGVLEEKTLTEFFLEVIEEMGDLGFLSMEEVEDNGQPTLSFTEMWDSAEVDALELGLSHQDYWGLKPKLVIELLNRKVKGIKDNMQKEIDLLYTQARLMAIGVNQPNKLKSAPRLFENESKEPETPESQAEKMLRLKGKPPSK